MTRRPVSSSTSRARPARSVASVGSITPPGVLQSVVPPRRWLRTSSNPSSDSTSAPATVNSVRPIRSVSRAERPQPSPRSEAVPEGPPGHEQERLEDDPARHLGAPEAAVTELDRDFDDASPLPFGEVGHLHLEAVAVGPHLVEINSGEVAAAVRAEAG